MCIWRSDMYLQYFCGDQLLRKGLLPASIERSDICIGGEILLPPLDKLPNRIFPTDNAILKQTVVEHATFYMHMQSFFWHGQPRIAELVFLFFWGYVWLWWWCQTNTPAQLLLYELSCGGFKLVHLLSD